MVFGFDYFDKWQIVFGPSQIFGIFELKFEGKIKFIRYLVAPIVDTSGVAATAGVVAIAAVTAVAVVVVMAAAVAPVVVATDVLLFCCHFCFFMLIKKNGRKK